MISNDEFRRILFDKSLDLSKEELEQIIDDELEKPKEVMDVDLIEYCLNEINILDTTEGTNVEKKMGSDTNGKHITHRFKRMSAIAVAAVLLLTGAVSVSAIVFNSNLFNSIVEFYDDHIRIRFDNSSNKASKYQLLGTSLAKELADNGISPVLLPETIFTKECKIVSIDFEKLDRIDSVHICFTKNEKTAYITIDQYADEADVPYTDYLHSSNKIETITISNLTVYVMEQNGKGTIAYQDYSTVYYIVTQLSFEDAVSFARTIK